MAVPCSAAPFTLKAAEFYVSVLRHNIAITFRSAHFYWCSLWHIFCSKSWKFSYISVTWTAWASGIEGNSFPSWSNIAFKLTLDDSVKCLHCPEVCSSCNSSILGCYFSILDHRPLSNTLPCLTASSYKMIILHLHKRIPLLKAW